MTCKSMQLTSSTQLAYVAQSGKTPPPLTCFTCAMFCAMWASTSGVIIENSVFSKTRWWLVPGGGGGEPAAGKGGGMTCACVHVSMDVSMSASFQRCGGGRWGRRWCARRREGRGMGSTCLHVSGFVVHWSAKAEGKDMSREREQAWIAGKSESAATCAFNLIEVVL